MVRRFGPENVKLTYFYILAIFSLAILARNRCRFDKVSLKRVFL